MARAFLSSADFGRLVGEGAGITVVVGNNGTGKSTLLRNYVDGPVWNMMVRNGTLVVADRGEPLLDTAWVREQSDALTGELGDLPRGDGDKELFGFFEAVSEIGTGGVICWDNPARFVDSRRYEVIASAFVELARRGFMSSSLRAIRLSCAGRSNARRCNATCGCATSSSRSRTIVSWVMWGRISTIVRPRW